MALHVPGSLSFPGLHLGNHSAELLQWRQRVNVRMHFFCQSVEFSTKKTNGKKEQW